MGTHPTTQQEQQMARTFTDSLENRIDLTGRLARILADAEIENIRRGRPLTERQLADRIADDLSERWPQIADFARRLYGDFLDALEGRGRYADD